LNGKLNGPSLVGKKNPSTHEIAADTGRGTGEGDPKTEVSCTPGSREKSLPDFNRVKIVYLKN